MYRTSNRRSRSKRFGVCLLLVVSLGFASICSALAAEPPAAASKTFALRLSGLSERHRKTYVPFYFSLPAGWTIDAAAGTEQSGDVVRVERRTKPEGGVLRESFAVGTLDGVGVGEISRELMELLCEGFGDKLAAALPNFQRQPMGAIKFAGYDAFGFNFSFGPNDKEDESPGGWGRFVLLPGPTIEKEHGLSLFMLGTTAAELKSAADLGVKGDLATIIDSFKIGRPADPEADTAETVRLIERATSYLKEPTYPYENADRALLLIDEAIRLAPHKTTLLLIRSRINDRRGKGDESLADLNAAVQRAPDDLAIRLARAEKHLGSGELESAKADIDSALRIKPPSAQAYALLGAWHTHYKNRKFDEALSAYDEAVRLDPQQAEYLVSRGRVWEEKDSFKYQFDDKALADFDAALRLDPRLPSALRGRATLHERHGRFREAVGDWDAIVDLDPKNQQNLERRAELLLAAHDWDRAVVEFEKLIAKATENDFLAPSEYAAPYLKGRGDAYFFGKQDYAKALADYDAAASRSSQFNFLRVERPEAWVVPEQLKAALAEIDQAVAAAPDDADVLRSRAGVRYLDRNFAGVIEDLDKALVGDKRDSSHTALRGLAKLHLERDDEAADDFQKAVDLYEAENDKSVYKDRFAYQVFLEAAERDIRNRRIKPAEKSQPAEPK